MAQQCASAHTMLPYARQPEQPRASPHHLASPPSYSPLILLTRRPIVLLLPSPLVSSSPSTTVPFAPTILLHPHSSPSRSALLSSTGAYMPLAPLFLAQSGACTTPYLTTLESEYLASSPSYTLVTISLTAIFGIATSVLWLSQRVLSRFQYFCKGNDSSST